MLVRVASTTTDTTDHEGPPRRRRDRWDAHRRSQGVLDGVTVNPTFFAKVGGSHDEVLQICQITPAPAGLEVQALSPRPV